VPVTLPDDCRMSPVRAAAPPPPRLLAGWFPCWPGRSSVGENALGRGEGFAAAQLRVAVTDGDLAVIADLGDQLPHPELAKLCRLFEDPPPAPDALLELGDLQERCHFCGVLTREFEVDPRHDGNSL